MIVYKGENIRSTSSRMAPVDITLLRDEISSPKEEFKNAISRLRQIKELDRNQYANAKRDLPYIVCGVFSPPYRRLENFSHIEMFVMDIDYLSENGYNLEEVRNTLSQDSRVLLAFASPSGDGLKVFFRLKEKCYDYGEFSVFYKLFAYSFALHNNLMQVIDTRTSDVTRACFMSADENVYYNPDANSVDIKMYLDIDNPFAAFSKKTQIEQFLSEREAKRDADESACTNVSDDTLEHICHILSS